MNGKLNIKKEKSKYDISLLTYLQFVSIVFLLTGLGLFMYCQLERIHPMELQVISSPVHWLVMGIVLFVVFFVKKYEQKKLNRM